jgi:valyl-tRNA synthetase
MIERLARVSEIAFADAPPAQSAQIIVRGEVAALPLAGIIDLDVERARLTKEMAKLDQDIAVVASSAIPTSWRARPRKSSMRIASARRRRKRARSRSPRLWRGCHRFAARQQLVSGAILGDRHVPPRRLWPLRPR